MISKFENFIPLTEKLSLTHLLCVVRTAGSIIECQIMNVSCPSPVNGNIQLDQWLLLAICNLCPSAQTILIRYPVGTLHYCTLIRNRFDRSMFFYNNLLVFNHFRCGSHLFHNILIETSQYFYTAFRSPCLLQRRRQSALSVSHLEISSSC